MSIKLHVCCSFSISPNPCCINHFSSVLTSFPDGKCISLIVNGYLITRHLFPFLLPNLDIALWSSRRIFCAEFSTLVQYCFMTSIVFPFSAITMNFSSVTLLRKSIASFMLGAHSLSISSMLLGVIGSSMGIPWLSLGIIFESSKCCLVCLKGNRNKEPPRSSGGQFSRPDWR